MVAQGGEQKTIVRELGQEVTREAVPACDRHPYILVFLLEQETGKGIDAIGPESGPEAGVLDIMVFRHVMIV